PQTLSSTVKPRHTFSLYHHSPHHSPHSSLAKNKSIPHTAMGRKRKTRSATKGEAPASAEDSHRMKKRIPSESAGDYEEDEFVAEEVSGGEEVGRESRSDGELVGEAAEESGIPVRRVVRNEAADGEDKLQAKRHFSRADVDGQIYCLEDDAYVNAGEGNEDYICKIIEFFEAIDGSKNFTAQWYYRASDTHIKTCGDLIDKKRIFTSEVMDDNPLDCLVKKLKIIKLSPEAECNAKKLRSTYDYYVDKKYSIPFTSFVSLPSDATTVSNESGSTISDADDLPVGSCESEDHHGEKTMLDLYSGCGAMSTGLCLGANSNGVKLVTGTVDVICGGPPCQGISGFNRFRNKEAPLEDPKNKQLNVFMDIVDYLRPKFLLMENVVDILKFCNGYLFRYALGRLIAMDYQARMGLMAAGAYGLPQFRMRMFMWGALPTERLPQYPLPTHNVVNRGVIPREFEGNPVTYEKEQEVNSLKPKLYLGDAISDLPKVENNEKRDEIPYGSEPQTEFQRFIRLRRDEMPGSMAFHSEHSEHNLFDHRPLKLNQDDYERVCQIPKKKGANFRDLPGVRVREDNKVEWDPAVERKTVSSGKPLVPEYAMTFVGGRSSKPFGRLWWDETVPTVVTRAEPHNQAILHPLQNRVLSVRENARLQGFPDYYRLLGPVKERYIQIGNAVAMPVARALGYSLALALKGLSGDAPLLTLPHDYPMAKDQPSPAIVM
ncbi:cytosine-specific methyltransferase, partial [Striga asiatica]